MAFAAIDPPALAAAIGAVAVLLGMLFAWLVRRQDHHTWVLARAPELPIRVLASGDDAWLRGTVLSDAPLRCPWFDTECVAYQYSIERKVTTTTTDSKGRKQTHTSWRTEHSEADGQDFVLDDGATILVRMAGATNEALAGLSTDYETMSRRHSASVLELGAEISVLGVRQDDRSFAGEREVPLLLTRDAPRDRVRSSARSEAALFTFAWLLPLLGGFAAIAILHGDPYWREPVPLALAALAGVGLALPFWAILTHNRLVRLRQMVRAAFRQVDVDLAVRADLVPNLVATVRGAAAHEHDLLRDLTALRSGKDPHAAVAADQQAQPAMRTVLALHERYPQLRADALYRDLHQRLWAVEEKLQHTRSLYNDVVTEWNDRIARFPSVLVARLSGCRVAPLFAGDDAPLPPPLNDRDSG